MAFAFLSNSLPLVATNEVAVEAVVPFENVISNLGTDCIRGNAILGKLTEGGGASSNKSLDAAEARAVAVTLFLILFVCFCCCCCCGACDGSTSPTAWAALGTLLLPVDDDAAAAATGKEYSDDSK